MKMIYLLLLLPLTSFAQELKVMTWNTFLLPPPWNMTKQAERTELMTDILPELGHDVMFFQETFFDKKRNDLIKALKKTHPHVAIPRKGKKLKQVQDSGLFVASKHPMEVLDQVIFKNCAKSDCLSSKSAIMVEITMPNGKKAQMINTHLQAWDEPKTLKIRKQQLEQIKEMMARHAKPGVPQILIGDLNIDANIDSDEYKEALTQMDMTNEPLVGELKGSNGFPTAGCFKKPGDNKEQWLDHLWLKKNGSEATVSNRRVFALKGEFNNCECPLSDHYPVEATIKL